MSDRDWNLRPFTIVFTTIAIMLLIAREQGVVPANQLVVSPQPSEMTYQEAEPQSEQSSQKADLKAQESMAAAAWVASIASLFALAGLALTVHFAREAWKAATKSADADNEALELTRTQLGETRKTTNAALEGTNITRLGVIPYPVVCNRPAAVANVSFDLLGGVQVDLELKFNWHNVGQTPLTSPRVLLGVCPAIIGEKNWSKRNFFSDVRTLNYADVGANDIREVEHSNTFLEIPMKYFAEILTPLKEGELFQRVYFYFFIQIDGLDIDSNPIKPYRGLVRTTWSVDFQRDIGTSVDLKPTYPIPWPSAVNLSVLEERVRSND